MSKHYDVVFIGGAIMAASTAYTLLQHRPDMKVLMIEKDTTYKHAATPLALGGVRQQFSERVNIRMARHSIETFEKFGELMETKTFGKPEIDFRQGGYLFLVSQEKWDVAMENAKVQMDEGVELEILTREDIARELPDLDLTGIAGATTCRREGLVDPQAVLNGYLRKVKEMGAEIVKDEVVSIQREGDTLKSVTCASGQVYTADAFVNASGPWAKATAQMAGVDLPVEPLRHDIYVTKVPMEIKLGAAYTTLPSTTWWFREHQTGDTMLCGKTKLDFELGFDFTVDMDYFEEEIWPDLADRMEDFDNIKLINAWRGCYEYNTIDFNAIIGKHPETSNFYLINGFSGHGMMQAPAAGRGLAELILFGEYKSLDLSELGYERFAANKLVIEKAII